LRQPGDPVLVISGFEEIGAHLLRVNQNIEAVVIYDNIGIRPPI
jgi:hypothetical protein